MFGLGAAGAVLGALSLQTAILISTDGELAWVPRLFGFASAACLGLAAYLSREVLSSNMERIWVHSRSAAEALKSEAFCFAMQVSRYKGAEGKTALIDKLQELRGAIEGAVPVSISRESALADIPPYPLSIRAYIEHRLDDQIYRF